MQGSDLFRKEVMHAQRAQALGVVRLAVPISLRMGAVFALLTVGVITTWLFVGSYTRREHVAGQLVPQAGLITVTSRGVGTVASVTKTEGSQVRAGDILLTISGERSSQALGNTAENISAQLRSQQQRLTEDLANTRLLATQQDHDLHLQQDTLRGQIKQLDAQIAIQTKQVASLSSLLAKFEPLRRKGFVSELDIQQQQTQEMQAESEVKALGRERFEAQQQLNTAIDQLQQLPLATQSKLSDLQRQIAQAEQTLDSNEAERATVLRAPQDGVVSALLVKPGQAVTADQAVVSMVPMASPLLAQILVPSSAIGFVRLGTPVVLHYQAFPYQKFGVQHGVVRSVSTNALTPNEVTALLGTQPPSEALYRVDVALEHQDIDAYGSSHALKPGMALDADLMLDKRRLIEWIFEPLYGMRRRVAADST